MFENGGKTHRCAKSGTVKMFEIVVGADGHEVKASTQSSRCRTWQGTGRAPTQQSRCSKIVTRRFRFLELWQGTPQKLFEVVAGHTDKRSKLSEYDINFVVLHAGSELCV